MKKVILALLVLMGTCYAEDTATTTSTDSNKCDVSALCPTTLGDKRVKNCGAGFGAFPSEKLESKTQNIVNEYLAKSMHYLFMASHFNEYKVNRKGFHSFFSKLSDASWDNAVELIQYMVERGGKLKTKKETLLNGTTVDLGWSVHVSGTKYNEMEALGHSLTMEKKASVDTLKLIEEVSINGGNGLHHDGEFAHFLSDVVSDKLVPRVKNLANHIHTLQDVLDKIDPSATTSKAATAFVLHTYDTQFLN